MSNLADLTPPSLPGGAALARLRQVMAGLGCTPAECIALSVLVAGALAALVILWMMARPGQPVQRPPVAGRVQVEAEKIAVHVAGAVTAPGLYRLAGGSRVDDALAAAGGPLAGAALDELNLARLLTDGEQIVVPATPAAPGPAGTPVAPSGAPSPPDRSDGKLNLNRATVQDLDALPGIGPVLAQRITGYREKHGPFKTVGKLRDVPGIGERTFQQLAPLVAVG
jgi:competence protein ComEA